MMDDQPRAEIIAIMDEIVEELLDQIQLKKPPVDAIEIAQKHLGMTVILDARQHERGRVQLAGKKPQIVLRPEPLEERHQWTVAHEIAQHFRTQLLERLHITAEEARTLTGESLNTLFSSRLLVPMRWFGDYARDTEYDLPELKEIFSTASNEVVALRFLDLSMPTIITVIDNGEIHRRKSNGLEISNTEMTPIELQCQEYVNKKGQAHVATEGDWTVQGWPIHQSDWKREILRSVVAKGAT